MKTKDKFKKAVQKVKVLISASLIKEKLRMKKEKE